MVLKGYPVIFVIASTLFVHLSGALNFEHADYDDLSNDGDFLEEPRTIFRTNLEGTGKENKFEIQLRLGNGVTVGCEVEKRTNYEDITELYLEDEFGRRAPEMGEAPPQARYRTTHSLFTRHPEATADLLEMEVPYGWWPAECIQRIMGLSFENTLCNCPSGPPGLTGRPGPEGPPGIPGPPGWDGKNGTHGDYGHPGDEGPAGPPGNKGRKGPPGAPGLPGGPGSQGPPGNPGRDGRDGVAGPPGAPGQSGKPGKDGRNGRNGRNGLQGPPGEAGIAGVAGIAGIPGEQGLLGIPAPSGGNGINGINGNPGSPGSPGENGQCGWTPGPGHSNNAGESSTEVNVELPEEDLSPAVVTTSTETEDEGGWTAGSDNWADGDTASQAEPAASPSPNPNVIPAKPAQSAQNSYQSLADMAQQNEKPSSIYGPNNPYMQGQIGGRPQSQPISNLFPPSPQHGPLNMNTFHDKRPDFPVSHSFQGPNALWSSQQFQSNLPLLQSYPPSGSYWKNTGTRAVPATGKGKGKLCAKNRSKGKNRTRGQQAQPLRPVAEPKSKVEIEEVLKDDIRNAPPRARVDLDVLDV